MSIDLNARKHIQTLTAAPFLALLLFVSGCGEQESATMEQDASAVAPIAEVVEQTPAVEATEATTETQEQVTETAATVGSAAETATAAETVVAAVDGEAVYQKACMACHAAGVAGAPKLGDAGAWAPRIAKGADALTGSVMNGLNAMPPKGGCMSCSDDELRGAVEYLVSQGS